MKIGFQVSEICNKLGVKYAILSPGSRCAPLSISFAQNNSVKDYVISDERSAAFIGLGISQATKTPVVLTCTSGTALLNYGPAVAEAFFNQIPLIVISADRPPEWIDQRDGQTIHQQDALRNHVKASFQLPLDDESEETNSRYLETFSDAISLATEAPYGPVHINIPFEEPFYPTQEVEKINLASLKIKHTKSHDDLDIEAISKKISKYENILIVAGQGELNLELADIFQKLEVPIISDIISNYSALPNAIHHHDIFLKHKKLTVGLHPDLVLTIGKSVISKNLKLFLRETRGIDHWHIDSDGSTANTYQKLKKSLKIEPADFFKAIVIPSNKDYLSNWQDIDRECRQHVTGTLLTSPFNEFSVVETLIKNIPSGSILHLANSTPVRYANFINTYSDNFTVYCNRGTSGIDGSISTAYGTAMVTDQPNILITGDMSFFYDRNAFWNNYLPNNLKIVVLNNHGGGIFRLINGPSDQTELENYFVTKQPLSIENTLKDYKDIGYTKVENYSDLHNALDPFFSAKGPRVLEVITTSENNVKVFKEVMLFERTQVK